MPSKPTAHRIASQKLSLRVVALGGAVAIALAALVGTAAMQLTLWRLVATGLSVQSAYGFLFTSPTYIVIDHILVFLCNAIGGYVASSLAASRPVAHGVAAGVCGLLFASLSFLGPIANPLPLWSVLLWFAIPLPAAAAGAYVRTRQA
jgi:hypothetical protein